MNLSSTTNASHEQVLVLEPDRGSRRHWLNLWRYRELFVSALEHMML